MHLTMKRVSGTTRAILESGSCSMDYAAYATRAADVDPLLLVLHVKWMTCLVCKLCLWTN